jgi:hypothetical protein
MRQGIERQRRTAMDRIEELLADEGLRERLGGCADSDALKALARERGMELTDAEAARAAGLLDVCLSHDDLDKVSGGSNGEMIHP